jgi:hypothetical protein
MIPKGMQAFLPVVACGRTQLLALIHIYSYEPFTLSEDIARSSLPVAIVRPLEELYFGSSKQKTSEQL